MKRFITWTLLAVVLMIGFPWLTLRFAGMNAMGICVILFYVINPLFSIICGVFAGKDIKQLWPLPIITSALFLAGTWMFFEMGETAFLLYCGYYLVTGIICMLLTCFITNKKV